MRSNKLSKEKLTYQIRIGISIFIFGLFISGITAFPIETELRLICEIIPSNTTLGAWLLEVLNGITDTNNKYPYMAYGTDWLAFAHIVLAVLFYGPWKNPVKNIWVIEFGIIACIGIFPLAFIAGTIREIPFFHQLIDCSFGVFGGLIMYYVYKKTKTLEQHA